ncbi:type I polyketide synthase [Sorangium atrum]|uniref:Type I polyketide synthase n=1 Tax=Sorangium atrum TaxID=2995308 RepID=A0ABT5BTG0_9BACT|nr:type I polyketide synthase [Sorangium aterium]MDC0676176.1 type I polyketide synthase [Sorangium aterium]
MSQSKQDQSTALLRALVVIEELEARLASVERARTEPVAVIGTSCRMPLGADSPEAFWELLREGVDATSDIPSDRWDVEGFFDPDPQQPGKSYTRRGSFLRSVDQFDPSFFGISPREAQSLDPQQRLLLEVSWEALERAGQSPDALFGSSTGVFIGMMSNDYAHLISAAQTRGGSDGYAASGNEFSFAAGRLSYVLGLQGPSMVVTTACSSSLVAIHLACQSLRNGECRVALAGGASLMLSPDPWAALSRLRALAPDGRCKTFDASADGYGRGEGCGVVVLKRLSDALADGDNVLAILRGSAVNHDGPSGGLTVPNGVAQRALIRRALEAAGVEASQVSYVEAHGTGTSLGDPIELNALGEVFGPGRSPERPLWVGAVKANIGHLEAAAGVAGVLKVALAMQHGELPAQPHLRQPSPHVAWSELPVRVPMERTRWPSAKGERRVAGVSSFGMSGINAHVVLEEAPERPEVKEAGAERPAQLLCISAKREEALRALAGRYAEHLGSHPDEKLGDVGFTAHTGRAHFAHRLSVVASSRAQMQERLSALARGEPAEQAEQGRVERAEGPRVAFLFTGQGSQYVGMGRELFATEPVFRRAIEECDALLRGHLERPLIEVLYPSEGQASPLDETGYTQPALFAVEYALSAQWKAWGIEPIAVLGHSVGEYVAACVAGVMGLEQGLELIAMRGRLMQALPKQGAMAALFADEATVAEAVSPYAAEVSVAAVNGPLETVVSGARGAVTAVVEALEARGVKSRWLNVSHAFHSPLMGPMVEAFERAASKVKLGLPQRKLIANVTGRAAGEEVTQASYWSRHVRAPVRFMEGIRALQEAGAEAFVEVGPSPVLSAMGRRCVPEGVGVWLPSLRPKRSDCAQMLESLGALYVRGAKVDFAGFDRDRARRKLVLPTYPFQRRRCWIDPPSVTKNGAVAPASADTSVARYYDALSTVDAGDAPERDSLEQAYLTFPPFREAVPEFSWLRTMARPRMHAADFARVSAAQREMRQVAFRHVDFLSCSKVLDFGCGHAADLIALAEQHPHLELHGYTISPEQARIGHRKLRARRLEDRVKIFNCDSTRHDFPSQYDVILGFEVAAHIADKDALFANVSRHLQQGGFVVMADFVSNGASSIVHEETSSYLVTRDEWCDLFARYRLSVAECVDVSREVGNFFHDERLEERFAEVGPGLDPLVLQSFRSYANLGRMLEKKLVSYVLLVLRKDGYARAEHVSRAARGRMSAPLPYAAAAWGEEMPAALENGALHPLSAGARAEASLDAGVYAVEWSPLEYRAASPRPASESPGSWLVVADRGGVGARLASLLEAKGERCDLVRPSDAARCERLAEILRDAAHRDDRPLRGLLHLGSLDAGTAEPASTEALDAAQAMGCVSLLASIQALADVPEARSARLWAVTRGAQPVSGAGPAIAAAPVWGLGRVAALEYPEQWGGLLDLAPEASDADAALLLDVIERPDGEDQIAFRGGQRHVARLARQAVQEAPQVEVRADAIYLITGGLGALGLAVARWLFARGARHLTLVGRRGLPPRDMWADLPPDHPLQPAISAVRALEVEGTSVRVIAADVGDEARMTELFASLRAEELPLRGIVHAAGFADTRPIPALDEGAVEAVLRAKVRGAWLLDRLARGAPLDFFVSFSSIASVWGSAGMAHYAAANAFLDALAHARRREGRPYVSVNWGPWADGGMASPELLAELERIGITALSPGDALAMLERLAGGDVAQAVVARVDLRVFKAIQEAMRRRPLFERLEVEGAPREPAPAAGEEDGLWRHLSEAPPRARSAMVVEHVRSLVVKIMKLEPLDPIDPRRPLRELGLDSLMAVELRNLVERSTGRRFSATLLIDYPTLEALSRRVAEELLGPEVGSDGRDAKPRGAGPPPPEAAADLDALSEEQMAAALAEELAAMRTLRLST